MTSNRLLSILIVDDEVELASLYRSYLETVGYYVVSFTDPIMALEYYKQNIPRFTHVLIDLRMPQMTGLDLACEIRWLNEKVNLFLMTAFEIKDLVNNRQYVDAHIEMVIQKPMRLKSLQEYLKNPIIQNNTNSIMMEKSIPKIRSEI